MAKIRYLEDVEAWQTARELMLSVYELTKRKPFALDCGLVDQMRHSAVRIVSNIAEGFESQTDETFVRFLGVSKASAGGLRSLVHVALDQNYISEEEFRSLIELCRRVSGQTSRFKQYLENSNRNPRP
jgi:four helix bundle protein